MLKIKDNVNLRELEKFGFKNKVRDIWSKDIENSDADYETSILINPTNAVIKNQMVHYTNNDKDLEDIKEDFIDLTSELDVLYDLIRANLVEKVEE